MNVCEATARLGADWDALQDLLPITSGRLVSVRSSGADSHDRGRVVLFFDFEGGHSLVYKPRATSPTNLVRHIAQLVPGFLATPVGLVRGTHEWAIFIGPGNLDTDEAAQSYYRAIGGLIAAADMLSFTDGHFENVVSALDGPTIVDVETYFHNPTGPLYDAEDAGGILRTSLVRDSAHDNGRHALGSFQAVGQLRRHWFRPHPINERSDQLRVEYRGYTRADSNAHLPKIRGSRTFPWEYVGEMAEGLTEAYQRVHRPVQAILASPAVAEIAEHSWTRHVARATLFYQYVACWSDQPTNGNGESRTSTALVTKAARRYLEENKPELPEQLRESEAAQIIHGDMPLFVAKMTSRDLCNSQGETVVREYFRRSALTAALTHLAQVDEDYVQQQENTLRRVVVAPAAAS